MMSRHLIGTVRPVTGQTKDSMKSLMLGGAPTGVVYLSVCADACF